jgi:hypothetical protein
VPTGLHEFFPTFDFSSLSSRHTPTVRTPQNNHNVGVQGAATPTTPFSFAEMQRLFQTNNTDDNQASGGDPATDPFMNHLLRQSMENFTTNLPQLFRRERREIPFIGPVQPPVIQTTHSDTGSLTTTVTSTTENATIVKTTEKGVNIINDNNIKIERDYLHHYTGHSYIQTNTVSFFGLNSDYVISGSNDGMIVVWDTKSAQIVSLVKCGDHNASSIKPRPKHVSFASCNATAEIKLWSPCGSQCTSAQEIDLFINRNANDPAELTQPPDSMLINIVQIQPIAVPIRIDQQNVPECSIQ